VAAPGFSDQGAYHLSPPDLDLTVRPVQRVDRSPDRPLAPHPRKGGGGNSLGVSLLPLDGGGVRKADGGGGCAGFSDQGARHLTPPDLRLRLGPFGASTDPPDRSWTPHPHPGEGQRAHFCPPPLMGEVSAKRTEGVAAHAVARWAPDPQSRERLAPPADERLHPQQARLHPEAAPSHETFRYLNTFKGAGKRPANRCRAPWMKGANCADIAPHIGGYPAFKATRVRIHFICEALIA